MEPADKTGIPVMGEKREQQEKQQDPAPKDTVPPCRRSAVIIPASETEKSHPVSILAGVVAFRRFRHGGELFEQPVLRPELLQEIKAQ